MKIQKTITLLMTAAVLGALPVQAQTSTQELFRVKFRATCRPSDTGNGSSSRMTERDLIEQCTGTGFTARELRRNFALVYNATTDSIQVVNAADGSLVCDAFLFQGGTNVMNGNRLERMTFVFSPNQAEAIGSAVITERAFNNSNRARISGKIQFMTVGTSNITATASGITNQTTGTTNESGIDTNTISGTGGLSDTNNVGEGSNTNTTNLGNVGGNTSGSFVQASAAAAATNTGVQICVGTFTAGRAFVPTPTTGAGGTNVNTGTNTTRDVRFVSQAAQSGLTEVQLSQLALQNTTNQAVLDFAQRMIQDHTQSNLELTQLGASKGIDVPTTLDTAHQTTVNRLASLTGASFDRAFRTEAVSSHRATIQLFQTEAAQGSDADIQAFAQNNVPVLQQHLTDALQLPQ